MAIIGEKSSIPIVVGITLRMRFKNGSTIATTNLPIGLLYRLGTKDMRQKTNKMNSYTLKAVLITNGNPLKI